MSLILEALRKSEAERRRGNTPDVAMELPPAPLRTRNTTPAWLWPLLAAIVVVVLAWWLTGRRDAAQPATPALDAAIVEPAPVATAPAVVPQASIPAPALTTPAPTPVSEAPVRDVVAAPVAANPQPAPPPVRELPPLPSIPPPAPAPAATSMSMSGVKLSMHMWDASADKRFVILNGQRMSEGDRNGDVQVVAIERDGVLVERDGQRARVPLP